MKSLRQPASAACLPLLLVLVACSNQSGSAPFAGQHTTSDITATEVTVADFQPHPVPQLLTADDSEQIHTRFGTLAVVEHPDMGTRTLAVDGKTGLVDLDSDLMGILSLIRLPDRDTALVWSDCSGSSCGVAQYHLVELRAGAAPRLVDDIQFGARGIANPESEHLVPQLSVREDGSVLIRSAGDEPVAFVYADGQLLMQP